MAKNFSGRWFEKIWNMTLINTASQFRQENNKENGVLENYICQ